MQSGEEGCGHAGCLFVVVLKANQAQNKQHVSICGPECSLVKKDAGMLDAFGKGASEDIQLAKSELYSQMTWDKDSKSSAFAEPQVTTTLPQAPQGLP